MKRLTKREEELMNILWEKEAMFVKEVIQLLPDPKPHYNTISTIIRGLEEKGFIDHKQYGNTHRYFALISKDDYGKGTMKDFISKYFNHSYSSVVSMFVEEEEISTEEIKKLIEQVESSSKNQND
ncbi:MAG: BlaI/MecI/CopY family transcriptional regulator [Prolixibacteraceae bacterium]|jgi:BlaI family penicillinase repressor|nr:BlaI/MecI/CopY family transcriptional regulator [Prolixibacteraceae bacterium]